MNVAIAKARAYITGRFITEGSALAGTIRARCLGVEARLEVESPEQPVRVAAVVRTAERGCYVLQSLLEPVPVQRTATLNGEPLDPEAFP